MTTTPITEEELKQQAELFVRATMEGDAEALCDILRNTFMRENKGHPNIKLLENFNKLSMEKRMEFVLLSSMRAGANLNQINNWIAMVTHDIGQPVNNNIPN